MGPAKINFHILTIQLIHEFSLLRQNIYAQYNILTKISSINKEINKMEGKLSLLEHPLPN